MISALCFDFDGTLAHYTGDFAELNRVTFESLGLSDRYFDASVASFGERIREEGSSTIPVLLQRMLSDLELTNQNVTDAAELMISEYVKDMALLPGAREILELTTNLPRAIITNGPSDMQRAAIKQVGIEDYFQTIIVSGDEDVAVRKPDRRIFEIACGRLGAEPDHILMMGDNLAADVKGALSFGMQAIWIGQDESEKVERVDNTAALAKRLKEMLKG